MKIYLASFYSGRAGSAGTGSVHMRTSRLMRHYPHFLESFFYIQKRTAVVDNIRKYKNKNKIFLDSGAFSMFTQDVKVDLKAYAKFIRGNSDIVEVASNLDAIGKGNERLSYDRQKQLESMGVDVKPVHHVRDHDDWLKRYLDEGYDYIFLGGMVPENTATLTKWLDHVWSKYLTHADGTPKVKVHGFGLTRPALMFRYPWYSVNSTSWVTHARNGGIFLDIAQSGTIQDFKIEFGSRSFKRRDPKSLHFDCLRTAERKVVLKRLEELEAERPKYPDEEIELEKIAGYKMGLNPKALSESYGWRDVANIGYFQRMMNRRTEASIFEFPVRDRRRRN